ncbi:MULTISPECIES: monovalent cation/H+ antiporter complex subunit F [unclassified Roseitalea]|uniref:monovalent cation/H+ antiporter complex subunit F n=1 Tax=unclassified Roseitalea TaxID=2639107 RepID=UPI00273FB114|nr:MULTISPECIES: monovalent cation/H+ antiporter complex subunit F [unclassified Roseitalea]
MGYAAAITDALILLAMAMLAVAFVIEVFSIVVGRGLDEKIWALDTLTVSGVAFIGLYCMYIGSYWYFDIAVALGLVSFLATVVFAKYLVDVAKRGGDLDA